MVRTLSSLIQNLPKFTNYRLVDNDPEIANITADSRQVKPGSIFVAYKGVSIDGHHFIDKAITQGAKAIIIENAAIEFELPANVHCLRVPNGREALAYLSAAWYGYPSRKLTLIGITGTDGKTSVTNLIFHVLKNSGLKVGMISTVNAVIGDDILETGLHTTTPDAPDIQRYLAKMVVDGTEVCVLETTSHGLAHHRVTACDFDWAVVTNITHEHLDLHGSLAEYRLAKAKLFQMAAKGVVLNVDDWSFDFLRERIAKNVRIISYGTHKSAMIRATDVWVGSQSTRFHCKIQGENATITTPLVGAFNVSNILATLALVVAGMNTPLAGVLSALASFGGVPGRMERIDEGQPFTAIVDFAHTPNALRRALETVRILTDGRIIAVFGCAGLRDVEKRTSMGEIAAQLADVTILTAEDPRTENVVELIDTTEQAMLARGAQEFFGEKTPSDTITPLFTREADRGRAIYLAVQLARPGDIVIALGKGHEQSMCFGETEYPWDDRAAMRSALRGQPLLTLPTATKA